MYWPELDPDPRRRDGDIQQAALGWRRWRAALKAATFQNIGSSFLPVWVNEKDPLGLVREASDRLAAGVQRWLYRLTEQSFNADILKQIQLSRVMFGHTINEPVSGTFSPREILQRALSEPARTSAWLEVLFSRSDKLRGRVEQLWERRVEFAELAKLDPHQIESCCRQSQEVAQKWLDRTHDATAELGARSLADLIQLALARDASDGWPIRLTPRSLVHWLDLGAVFRDIKLGHFPLAPALGAASFLRALARLGAAWVEATAPDHLPYTISHDPYGLEERTFGALLALLPTQPSFLRRRMGLGKLRAREYQRLLARTVLIESRASALRLLLRPAALRGWRDFERAYQELGEYCLGFPLEKHQAGLIFAPREDADQRFSGLLLAASRADWLKEQHDEDWFRNPRAATQLRDEASLLPRARIEESYLSHGAEALYRDLLEALG